MAVALPNEEVHEEYVALEELPPSPQTRSVARVLGLLAAAVTCAYMLVPFARGSFALAKTREVAFRRFELRALLGEQASWTEERLRATVAQHMRAPHNMTDMATLQLSFLKDLAFPAMALLEDRRGKRADVDRLPAKCIGALFFEQGRRTNLCSAALVYDDVILTAGHCLRSPSGQLTTSAVFIPGMSLHAGRISLPYGRYFVKRGYFVDPGELSNAAEYVQHDYGFYKLDRSPGLGYLGTVWDQSADDLPNMGNNLWMVEYGYPASAPYPDPDSDDSMYQYQIQMPSVHLVEICAEHFLLIFCTSTAKVLAVRHDDFTPGSSGGPWTYAVGGRVYVFGSMSAGVGRFHLSPYFDDTFAALLDQAKEHA
mmetsp:Transcript_64157/g.186021  ORF Transcript_64157/g.186021 Transcript_64157/m.186021 type:complete len:369 (-) Transcript_64157:41-1147(-)